MITIVVPGLPPPINATKGTHWAVRRAATQPMRSSVAWQARAAWLLCGTMPRARVRITLERTGGRPRDPDGAVACCKEAIDALVEGRLLADDSPDHIVLEVVQRVGDVRRTIIDVEPLAVEVAG